MLDATVPVGTGAADEEENPDHHLWLRGKTYYFVVEINGRRERQSLRTTDVAKARKRRDELLEKADLIRAGEEPDAPFTWDEAVIAYTVGVLDRPGALSPKTAERYFLSLKMVARHLRGRPLDKIDSKVIGRLVTGRQAEVSNATIKRDLTAVSRVVAYAMAMGRGGEVNAARNYDRTFLSEDREVIPPPTDAEIAAAVRLVEDAHGQWPLLVRWLRATGMRLHEALSAQRAHLETTTENRKRVHRLSIYKAKGKRRARMRTITLGPDAVALLPQLGQEDYLFSHFDPSKSDNVSTQWLKFRESREGMPRFRLHDLRHAYAVTSLRADPTCLYPLSRHLGHSSVTTTERHYLRFLSDEQQHIAKFGQPRPAVASGGRRPPQSPPQGRGVAGQPRLRVVR